MKNYDRYKNVTAEVYEKKGIMYYLCRMPSDKKIIPLLSQIKSKNVLDVGLGTSYYTRILIENNNVTGIDQNPHLCNLPIKLYKGDASELCALVGEEKFGIVLSSGLFM